MITEKRHVIFQHVLKNKLIKCINLHILAINKHTNNNVAINNVK